MCVVFIGSINFLHLLTAKLFNFLFFLTCQVSSFGSMIKNKLHLQMLVGSQGLIRHLMQMLTLVLGNIMWTRTRMKKMVLYHRVGLFVAMKDCDN